LLAQTDGSLCLSTSSASASFGVADMAVYSATKHAIRGFTEALAVELNSSGVRVADVLPGIIDTAMLPDDASELFPTTGPFRIISPAVVAETVWDAYHGDSLHWFVPAELQSIDVDVRVDPDAARDARLKGPLN
ncbi:MAG: SDR family NAD(P)-dependent oxidoreductase, partial [Actinomycetota bacterium]